MKSIMRVLVYSSLAWSHPNCWTCVGTISVTCRKQKSTSILHIDIQRGIDNSLAGLQSSRDFVSTCSGVGIGKDTKGPVVSRNTLQGRRLTLHLRKNVCAEANRLLGRSRLCFVKAQNFPCWDHSGSPPLEFPVHATQQ